MNIPLIDRNNKIIMGWSAKAGCTISVKMFFDHMGILEEALNYNKWVHEFRCMVFYQKYGTPTEKDILHSNYFKFKVVRNPYHRAVSSFIHYIKYSNKPLSFVNFVQFLKTENLENCDIHWKLQSSHHDKYYQIVKLENITEEIEKINILRGTKFKPNFTSDHHHIKENSNHFVGDQEFMACNTEKTIPNYNDFYNSTIKEDITNLYNKDITGYGYVFE